MSSFFTKLFGSYNSRTIRNYERIVDKINFLENDIKSLDDNALKHKTDEFIERLEKGETLDDILPEAFAVVRETSNRVLGMRHFDVQLIGGMVLHEGRIAEMKTGEGKTLVATLAVYLNALTKKGVHVVTVNDYLAKRDANWMGQIYKFLGLSVSCIISGMNDSEKKAAYNADITYGTNHEFGFDYLRDNLKFSEDDLVMRPFNFGVVDEVDSILIDEARTPLIISGVDQDSSMLYVSVNDVVKNLGDGDFEKDEKSRVVTLTDQGVEKVEEGLRAIDLLKGNSLYDSSNVALVHYVNSALKAHKIFSKDVDYIVKDGQVMIIDEFTGRIMDGRRYSEGLHQAIEAKEGVRIQTESQTIATISYQNLFRLYPKLSGMTGTAMTEEAEFDEIYKLKVISIPSNKPIIRIDHEDSLYITAEEKYRAVINLIKECHSKGQPVLVGTTSIERSEYLSNLLNSEKIPHNVLNARHHEQEAYIISQAGAPGAVTIATNMAGRGTDIKLGGCFEMRVELECRDIKDPEAKEQKIQEIIADIAEKEQKVREAGGLFVVGTERNESRRIDNQLRGRSGRQGDPGASKYFLSLEDDLIKRFGSPNIKRTFERMGMKKDEEITHRWISKIIAKAQQKVEAYNFDIRKQLLRFDDVMNEQRKIIYEQRREIMKSNDVSETVVDMMEDVLNKYVSAYAPVNVFPDAWDIEALSKSCKAVFNIDPDFKSWILEEVMTQDVLKSRLLELVEEKYKEKEEKYIKEIIRYVEKDAFLRVLDRAWRFHLLNLEHLRRGINLRAYAQKNPLNEYKFEAFSLFQEMLESVREDVLTMVFHFEIENREPERVIETKKEENKLEQETPKNDRISRNAICFCGSGKKYKHCHGLLSHVDFQFSSNKTSDALIQDVVSQKDNENKRENTESKQEKTNNTIVEKNASTNIDEVKKPRKKCVRKKQVELSKNENSSIKKPLKRVNHKKKDQKGK